MQPKWKNVLLTDSGFYYDNELDKPLPTLINRLREMLAKPFDTARVLFIPTAAMQVPAKAEEITNRLRNELLQIGIQPQNITIHDIDGTLSAAQAMEYDIIYLTGGNTPYLAQRVFDAGFDTIIRQMVFANKIYVGMSAGSMLLMHNFNVDNLPNPERFVGLGLVDVYFTVHCTSGTPNRTDFPTPHISMECNQAIEAWDGGYKLLKEDLCTLYPQN